MPRSFAPALFALLLPLCGRALPAQEQPTGMRYFAAAAEAPAGLPEPAAAWDRSGESWDGVAETPHGVAETWDRPAETWDREVEPAAYEAAANASAAYLETAVLPASAEGEEEQAGSRLPLRLAPRSRQEEPAAAGGVKPAPLAITTTLGALAVVLGLFLLVAWLLRRSLPRGLGALPHEVVEVLGRAPLAGKQSMHLVRLGNKLLLISLTPAGAETLGEVEHPDEVQRLLALCRQGHPGSISAGFREVLAQFEQQPAAGGFFGAETPPGRRRA